MTKPKIPGTRLAPGLPPRHFFEVGQRIGRGIVIDADVRIPRPGRKVPRKRGDRAVRLVCDCGNEFVRSIASLVRYRNSNVSCGCEAKQPKLDMPNRAAWNAALNSYQCSARKRGLAWELTDEDFDRLTSRECHYCGSPPSAVWKAAVKYENGDFIYTGLDRKDSTLGYTPDNVVPCCKTCNYAKRSMSYDEFMTWITRLIAYHWFNPEMTPSRRLKSAMLRKYIARALAAQQGGGGWHTYTGRNWLAGRKI